MLSAFDSRKPAARPRRPAERLAFWNGRLHYYAGLYLLFFVWLFALTGLLLNHPGWKFADFWPTRKQMTYERAIQPLASGGDLVQARDIMRQLGIRGEIEWTAAPADSSGLDFRVTRPGRVYDIKADFAHGRAAIQQLQYNGWGVLRTLHTFTGAPTGDSRNRRDWLLTSLWTFSMDALAAGLIFMVLSGCYMCYRVRRKRLAGAFALLAGSVCCALFVIGLRLLT
jgi:hypothetical protein